MPIFEIKKTIYTTLVVSCNSLADAETWAEKIVATLETNDDTGIPPNVSFFEADFIQNELKVTKTKPQ